MLLADDFEVFSFGFDDFCHLKDPFTPLMYLPYVIESFKRRRINAAGKRPKSGLRIQVFMFLCHAKIWLVMIRKEELESQCPYFYFYEC